MKNRFLAAAMSFAALSACSSERPAAPAPMAAPAPTPTITPAPTPTPTYANWLDAPPTPGNWFYINKPPFSYAAFGDTATTPKFVMRCDRAGGIVSIGRESASTTPQPLRIITETSTRLLTGQPRQGSVEHLLAVDLPTADPLLDAMAISKGRFAVEAAGEPTLYIPSWPEVTHVIEDCR